MGNKLKNRIETWKKLLLDFSKRNRLINFLEDKRSNVRITQPLFEKLYEQILDEKELQFPHTQIVSYKDYLNKYNNYTHSHFYKRKIKENDEEKIIIEEVLIEIPGDISTNKDFFELEKTLKNLRYKANTSIEEQGINTLYLTFGMLKWKEKDNESKTYSSPLVLVPVKLLIESLISPYKLVIHDDEIVVNPTLSHKLNNDFGINIPEFDTVNESLVGYLNKVEHEIENKGWKIEKSIFLTNLSFLKINMYKDIEKNEEKLESHSIISAIVGEKGLTEIPNELNNYNHDKNTRPIDTFQVVDADSSQQDAVLLSKKGISFVLQGPPGTGKSQTITNIIAEAIADGKKVLFVSEKRAALEVVYNRLTSVGLSDFCLTLHSHKANKKEILQQLANSLNIERKRVRNEALTQLDILGRKRAMLNQYDEELHTETSALNISIFTVNGYLSKVNNAPDVIFPISDVDKITKSKLRERTYILKEFAKTVGKRSVNYSENVWRNSTVRFLSNELRHNIDSKISFVLPKLEELLNLHNLICTEFSISLYPSINNIGVLSDILSCASKSPIIPIEWIYNRDIEALIDGAFKYKELLESINKLKKELLAKYDSDIINIDADNTKTYLLSLVKELQERIKGYDNNSLVRNIEEINNNISEIVTSLSMAFDMANSLSVELGLDSPSSINELNSFVKISNTLDDAKSIYPTQKWFTAEYLDYIKSELNNHKELHLSVSSAKKLILTGFDRDILEWDFYPVLQRFRSNYNNFFRFLNGNYRKDIKQIQSYLINGGRLSYTEALNVLNALKVISDKDSLINNNFQLYKDNYGVYYNGLHTEWDRIENSIKQFENIINAFPVKSPDFQRKFINGELPYSKIEKFNKVIIIEKIQEMLENLLSFIRYKFDNDSRFLDVKTFSNKICSTASNFIKSYKEVETIRKEKGNFDSIISELELAISLNKKNKEVLEQENEIKKLYKEFYKGVDTDWDKLIDALEYAVVLKLTITKHRLSRKFVEKICNDTTTISYCKDVLSLISDNILNIQDKIKWYSSLFNDSVDFNNYNMADLIERMSACMNKKHLLEEWVDYCYYKEKCNEIDLGEYINKLEDTDFDYNYIVDSYLKRFFRLWLDAILPRFKAVCDFRTRIQTDLIKEFGELDKSQFKIAQARIREKVLNRMPDFNMINEARDEVAILKRELNKKKRIIPLRKLFKDIPNLITSLRPCFMMSPLSVSVFLEADSYNFDIVIFDEASQVHTEDAIGAIMRGKQIIIVGDTKQLPPTNFFSTSLNDDDFDFDSDESADDGSAGAYESILDEAVAVLPERSLRWHYRSRHEHLIAFSNIKIYNSQLITFPSPNESYKDFGVEYIYVKDGVYDRGGKKNNIIEAQKVADLVFEHFQKYPNRSLGVVTFSEAQQNAIDVALRDKRMKHPDFDKFFIEDKNEPFFIKNLENVQGDERDSIIFSIGYAKDSKGLMYMNFGPLSREGGYRRLNVAITRAKYNVKLVGSIQPTDIDLEKTSSEGVKMLRSYIEFAQQGIVALENELTYSNDLIFDSPFEESVYDFLQLKGYDVVTQVGCSGFRIDMAVKHPTQNGKFAIGIECDGATYHSSRTARERDRLRQTVLEDMGWTIYRIWSTDWIKEQKNEEEKLLKAIEDAFKGLRKDESLIHKNGVNNQSDSQLIIEEKIETTVSSNSGFDFDIYERVIKLKRKDIRGQKREDSDIIFDVISLEQPIHFEELCRRVAPIYGRQKVTSVVRNEVEDILIESFDGIVVIDKSNFVRLKDCVDIKVRKPNPNDDYVRPIAYICDEEIALAMKKIVMKSFGITQNDLFIVTAREFGYKRTSENIIDSLRKVYQQMLINGEVTEVDGKVQIV